MKENENMDILKYLRDFALIHQKMALSVHFAQAFPGELSESKEIVSKLHDETRNLEAEAISLATKILRLALQRVPNEEEVYKANDWWF